MTDLKQGEADSFIKIDGKLYYRASDGELIGPLNPAAPTCGDNTDGEQPND